MKKWQIINVLALVLTLVVNGLANYLPLNGLTQREISDSIPILFTPASYVFSIWGLIYLGLLAFAVYQALPARREEELLGRIGPWFTTSCILNAVWIILWHYQQFPLTLLLMVGLLASLAVIHLRLGTGRGQVSAWERWLVRVPFSIYLGWISVATIANVSVVLYLAQWNQFGLSSEIWTAMTLIVGAGLAVAMRRRRRDIAYPLVIIWAFAGVLVRHLSLPVISATAGVAIAAIVGALVVSSVGRTTNA